MSNRSLHFFNMLSLFVAGLGTFQSCFVRVLGLSNETRSVHVIENVVFFRKCINISLIHVLFPLLPAHSFVLWVGLSNLTKMSVLKQ